MGNSQNDPNAFQAGMPKGSAHSSAIAAGSPPGSAGAGSIATSAPSFSHMMLFWASFFTLIAAGMGFAIRGDILADWGRQFGFTQGELGIITGQGLAGFGLTIIFFSFFSDILG